MAQALPIFQKTKRFPVHIVEIKHGGIIRAAVGDGIGGDKTLNSGDKI